MAHLQLDGETAQNWYEKLLVIQKIRKKKIRYTSEERREKEMIEMVINCRGTKLDMDWKETKKIAEFFSELLIGHESFRKFPRKTMISLLSRSYTYIHGKRFYRKILLFFEPSKTKITTIAEEKISIDSIKRAEEKGRLIRWEDL